MYIFTGISHAVWIIKYLSCHGLLRHLFACHYCFDIAILQYEACGTFTFILVLLLAAPSALLFEYPLYGSLHSFLTCKRRGMISDNSNLWAGLENCSMEPNVLLAVPESSRKVLSPLLNDFDIRSRPFMAPLNEKLSHLDTLLFALQLADGMDFLDKSRVRLFVW